MGVSTGGEAGAVLLIATGAIPIASAVLVRVPHAGRASHGAKAEGVRQEIDVLQVFPESPRLAACPSVRCQMVSVPVRLLWRYVDEDAFGCVDDGVAVLWGRTRLYQ